MDLTDKELTDEDPMDNELIDIRYWEKSSWTDKKSTEQGPTENELGYREVENQYRRNQPTENQTCKVYGTNPKETGVEGTCVAVLRAWAKKMVQIPFFFIENWWKQIWRSELTDKGLLKTAGALINCGQIPPNPPSA